MITWGDLALRRPLGRGVAFTARRLTAAGFLGTAVGLFLGLGGLGTLTPQTVLAIIRGFWGHGVLLRLQMRNQRRRRWLCRPVVSQCLNGLEIYGLGALSIRLGVEANLLTF